MTTLATLQQDAIRTLRDISETARLDAELLIAHVLDIPRTRFITQPDTPIDAQQLDKVQATLAQRKQGVPVAYLIGSQHFWDVELAVTKDTLIPRPETEMLVETALTLFDAEQPVQLADLGTGSGAIAIAIAKARPRWQVLATDRYAPTLAIAQHNAANYQLDNIRFLQSNWFDQLPPEQRLDMIISNPPYVPEQDPHLQQGDVRFEPPHALRSGEDGLNDIRHLISTSRDYLKADGWLLLEHGYDQGAAVNALFAQAGYQIFQQQRDLGGHMRISYGKMATEKPA